MPRNTESPHQTVSPALELRQLLDEHVGQLEFVALDPVETGSAQFVIQYNELYSDYELPTTTITKLPSSQSVFGSNIYIVHDTIPLNQDAHGHILRSESRERPAEFIDTYLFDEDQTVMRIDLETNEGTVLTEEEVQIQLDRFRPRPVVPEKRGKLRQALENIGRLAMDGFKI